MSGLNPNDYVEQDTVIEKAGDELPTYDDLAEQGGPNSRYGPTNHVRTLETDA